MGIQKKEVEYAKEVDDVLVLVVELIADIKAGKSISAVAAENMPLFFDAVNGVGDGMTEVKEHRKVALETVGYRMGDLVDTLLPAAV